MLEIELLNTVPKHSQGYQQPSRDYVSEKKSAGSKAWLVFLALAIAAIAVMTMQSSLDKSDKQQQNSVERWNQMTPDEQQWYLDKNQ